MTDTETPQQDIRPRRKRRWVWHGMRVSVILMFAPVVFAMIAALMMFDRDITAPSWIKARISERAATLLAGGALDFGEITLNVGTDLHPRVRLTDTVLRDAEGTPVARIEEISGLMSPRGLLFRRAALMQEIDLRGTALTLARQADGSVAAQFSGADLIETAPGLVALLDQLDAVFERPELEALEQIRLHDLDLEYRDARGGQTWRVDDSEMALDLRGGVLRLRSDVQVSTGGVVPARVAFNFESPRDSRAAKVEIALTDVASQDLATQSPALSWLSTLDAPLSARLQTSIASNGDVAPLEVQLSAGAGTLVGPTPVEFDHVTANLVYSHAQALIDFESIAIDSSWGSLQASGQTFADVLVDGLPQMLTGQFVFSHLDLHPPSYFPQGIPLSGASADLRLRLDPLRIELGEAVVDAADGRFVLRGQANAEADGWSGALDVTADTLSHAGMLALWPAGVKPRTNAWFSANLRDVAMSGLAFGFRKDPGQPLRIAGGYDFANAQIKFMRDQPPIIDAAGYNSIANDRFVISLAAGEVIAPEGGRMDMAGSTMIMADLRANPVPMQLDIVVDSSLTAAMSILDRPPFEFITKAGFPVALADARARTTGRFSFPGDFPITRDQVTFDVTSALSRVRSDTLIPGRQLSSSALSVDLNRERLEVSGAAVLDGVPLTGRFTQGFAPDQRDRSNLTAEIALAEDTLDAFNVALPPGSVAGRGVGQLSVDLERGSAPRFSLTSDLRGITLALPPVGWAKPPSSRGTLEISGRLGAVPQIDRLRIAGGGLDAQGVVRLRDGGGLEVARFDRVQVGNWLDAPITLRGRGQGRPVGVEITGGLVDLRGASFGPREGESGPLSITLDRLQLSDGIALDDFRGDFQGQGGLNGQFTGQVNGAAAIRGTVVPQAGRSAVRIVSQDAGGVARAVGIIRNAVGGSLDVTLSPVGAAGTFDGLLRVRGLRLRDAPAMAALLDAVSVVGLLQQLDGQGLAFDEVDARFRLTPNQVIVAQSSAVGPGLGISLDGIYTLASKEVDFQGVISPFFIVNQIGSILTRRGEGLIGFNFNVSGPVASPRVSVNPLSVLTPGMFREIFRRPPPELSQ